MDRLIAVAIALLTLPALAQSLGGECKRGRTCAPRTLTVAGPSLGQNGVPYAISANMSNGAYKCGWALPANVTVTSLTMVGMTAQTSTGTGARGDNIAGTQRSFPQLTSGAVSGNTAGITPGATPICNGKMNWFSDVTFRVASTTALRAYYGATGATATACVLADGPTACAVDGAWVGYDSANAGGAFRCCSGDGTNISCVSFAGAVTTPAVASEYHAQVDYYSENGTAVTCRLWNLTAGTSDVVRKTTHLPRTTDAVAFAPFNALITTEAVAKTIQLAEYSFCYQ